MPLQIEDALSSLSFAHGIPLDLSPDGEWIGYTLKNPRRTEKQGDERYGFFTRSGVRIFEGPVMSGSPIRHLVNQSA